MGLEDYAYDCGLAEGASALLTTVGELEAENADLRDRLRIVAFGNVCEHCGCAPVGTTHPFLCHDCDIATSDKAPRCGACISVGMRALCGRSLAAFLLPSRKKAIPVRRLLERVEALEQALFEQIRDAAHPPPTPPDHSCRLGASDCDGECADYAHWERRRGSAIRLIAHLFQCGGCGEFTTDTHYTPEGHRCRECTREYDAFIAAKARLP